MTGIWFPIAQNASAITSLSVFPWFAWIPIVAIVFGCLTSIIKSLVEHRERMAMIHMGMHPDHPVQEVTLDGVKPRHPEGAEI